MKIDRARIVDEALQLLNEIGMDEFTTRELARRLGVRQPALYWHFASKRALLDATAVNPTYGDALIGLAIASYQQNGMDETVQALDNADRFDRDNPSIPLIRSGIALDQYQADEAIAEAREALRRRQLRGGYYSGYDTNRQASSFLGVALDNLALDDWGQYYADRAYDPFKSSTYIDEAADGRLSPFVGPPPSGSARRICELIACAPSPERSMSACSAVSSAFWIAPPAGRSASSACNCVTFIASAGPT